MRVQFFNNDKSHTVRRLKNGLLVGLALLVGSVCIPLTNRGATAATQSITLQPVADTYVSNSYSTTNFGSETTLTGSTSDSRAFIRWSTASSVPTGATLTSVKMRLYVTKISVTAPGAVIHPASNSWQENTLTAANQPAWNSTVIASSGAATVGQWLEIDIPVSSVKLTEDTTYGIRYSASGSNFRFASREYNATNKPQLILTYEEAAPTPTEPVSGTQTVTPTQDTLARASESTVNFGTAPELDATSSDNRAYLKFPTSGLVPVSSEVTAAVLRVYTTRLAVTSGGYEVHPAIDGWQENTLTWANQPAWNTTVLATSSTPQLGQWVDIPLPVNSINLDGNTNLALRYTASGSLARFASREHSNLNKPQLLVSYQTTQTEPTVYPTLMAAGDVACRPGMNPTSTTCQQAAVANLIAANNPTAVAALGDLQYDTGTYTDFMGSYDLSWGQFKPKTRPAIGNHEYTDAAGNAKGYFDYFNGVGVQTGLAGDRSKGYYSYDLGAWHVVVLNSECWSIPGDGCNTSSAQYNWLKQDLAANNATCTLAYWHQPRFTNSSGYAGNTDLGAMWNLMVGDVDVLLTGHTHTVEIFKKIGITPTNSTTPVLSPTGIKQFVIGSGGRSFHPFATTPVLASDGTSAVEARNNNIFGALHMTLKPTGYDWKMMGINGQTYTNIDTQTTGAFSGSESCN